MSICVCNLIHLFEKEYMSANLWIDLKNLCYNIKIRQNKKNDINLIYYLWIQYQQMKIKMLMQVTYYVLNILCTYMYVICIMLHTSPIEHRSARNIILKLPIENLHRHLAVQI